MKNCLFLWLMLLFAFQPLTAQNDTKEETLEVLREQLATIEEEEKKGLKKQIENINSLFNNGVIDKIKADELKLKAAENIARKIEERQQVIVETIAYLEEKESRPKMVNGAEIFLDVDAYFNEKDTLPPQPIKKKPLPRKPAPIQTNLETPIEVTELRSPTSVDLVFAMGLNNVVKDGVTWYDLEDGVDYSFYDSRFFEIGLALKTPLMKKNGLRLKYGLSFQSNKLEINGNRSYTESDGITSLEASSRFLGESRFVVNNLVLPVHFEFGPTKKRQNNKGSYYSTKNKFKIGIGGYAGLNLSARQRVQNFFRYRNIRLLGEEVIDGYTTNQQIYGASAYIGFGAFSVYGKYDLNTIFENSVENEQFVSFGLRIDL